MHILVAKCKEEQCTPAWHGKKYFDWTALTFELRSSKFIWMHYIFLKLKELPISELIHFSLKPHLWQQGQRTNIFQLFSLNYSEMSVTPRHSKPRITKVIIQYYGWALSPHSNAQQRAPTASMVQLNCISNGNCYLRLIEELRLISFSLSLIHKITNGFTIIRDSK